MKILLCYVPVVQQSYLDFFSAYTDARIFIWGNSLITLERSLRKEIRALEPWQAVIALQAVTGRTDIHVAELEDLPIIADKADPLVMPDDAISHMLLEQKLMPLGIKSRTFHRIFLRWDSRSAKAQNEVEPDEVRRFPSLLELAKAEASKSSDWWRQIGAVLFNGKGVLLSAYNHHLPTEYAPLLVGDPRLSFHKGADIELTTAIHAEAAVIAEAAKRGIKTEGLKLLVTTFPCPVCAKLIAASGIAEVLFSEGYGMLDGEQVLRDAGVKIVKLI